MTTSTHDDAPRVWPAVLERFRDGYGNEPDFDDRTDRFLLVQLLEEAVRDQITDEIVRTFRDATARIEASTRALREERS